MKVSGEGGGRIVGIGTADESIVRCLVGDKGWEKDWQGKGEAIGRGCDFGGRSSRQGRAGDTAALRRPRQQWEAEPPKR
jgi:hypothetical protein